MKFVDLFAGLGGFSEGVRLIREDQGAAEAQVVWAANHCPDAVKWHSANHPATAHACQDLRQADFTMLPPYDVLLASPACQGHSQASQPRRRPKHDADRATAWAVVDCVEKTRPRYAIIENVPHFRRWPLYNVWKLALETLGYTLSEQLLDAHDFRVPQNRVRLFITATRSGQPAPYPTDQHPGLYYDPGYRPHVSAVFEDDAIPPANQAAREAAGWEPVRNKPDRLREQVLRAQQQFGEVCLVQQVSRPPGRALARPIGTVTCARNHWCVVNRQYIRPLSVRELARAQGFRDSYQLPTARGLGTRLVGNAVPPQLAASVIYSVWNP